MKFKNRVNGVTGVGYTVSSIAHDTYITWRVRVNYCNLIGGKGEMQFFFFRKILTFLLKTRLSRYYKSQTCVLCELTLHIFDIES